MAGLFRRRGFPSSGKIVLRVGGEHNFLQAALMSVGYFAVAALAFLLARYAQDSERLAAQRGSSQQER